MPSRFNAGPLPPGLLGFLQLKNSGRLPDFFGDVLTPTMDLRDWYLQAELREGIFTDSIVGDGVSQYVVFAPNDPEAWYVHQVSVITDAMASTDTLVALYLRLEGPSGDGPVIAALHSDSSGSFTDGSVCAVFTGGFFLQPGWRITLRAVSTVATTNLPFTAEMNYTPLKI